MRVSKIIEERRELRLSFPSGDYLKFTYKPNSYTPKMERMNAKVAADPSAGVIMKSLILPLLAEWDLEDEFRQINQRVMYDKDGVAIDRQNRDDLGWDDRLGQLVPCREEEFDNEAETVFKVVPLTELGLDRVPVQTMLDIHALINEDTTPGKRKSPASGNSFS